MQGEPIQKVDKNTVSTVNKRYTKILALLFDMQGEPIQKVDKKLALLFDMQGESIQKVDENTGSTV